MTGKLLALALVGCAPPPTSARPGLAEEAEAIAADPARVQAMLAIMGERARNAYAAAITAGKPPVDALDLAVKMQRR